MKYGWWKDCISTMGMALSIYLSYLMMMPAMIILVIDTVGAIYYDMIIGRCAGAVSWHILWIPCGDHSICYEYISIYRSKYRDKFLSQRKRTDVVRVWDMCSRELMMNRENKREQIASRDREKNHYASEKNNL